MTWPNNTAAIIILNVALYRGVGTGPADPAAAGPKFALSIKIETHNSKKINCLENTQLRLMQLAISTLYNLLFLTVSSDNAKLQWPFDLSSRNNLFY